MPIVKKIVHHKVLLDTHVWIWLMEGSERLSKSFSKAIDHLSQNEHILISPISIWELGMLAEKKRIELDRDSLDWVEEALNFQGIRLIPITPSIAIQSTRLPGTVHGDPA